jgi:septal ring-binding cell division protein DamX
MNRNSIATMALLGAGLVAAGFGAAHAAAVAPVAGASSFTSLGSSAKSLQVSNTTSAGSETLAPQNGSSIASVNTPTAAPAPAASTTPTAMPSPVATLPPINFGGGAGGDDNNGNDDNSGSDD